MTDRAAGTPLSPGRNATRVTAAFFGLGLVFYALGEWLLVVLIRDPARIPFWHIGKEVLFVAGGSVLVFLLTWRANAAWQASRTALLESEQRYRELFVANPNPMWVYDLETLAFLEVNDAAVACEATGNFYLAQGREYLARLFLQEALAATARWGARARVRHLEERYREILKQEGHARG